MARCNTCWFCRLIRSFRRKQRPAGYVTLTIQGKPAKIPYY